MAADKTDSSVVDPLDPGDEATVRQPAEAEPPDAKPARKRNKRTWKRRLWLTLIVLLILGVVIRIAVQLAFPIVLDQVAAGYGLDADYDQFRMSMLSGDVGLGRLEFKSQKSGQVFASANYVRATISPLKLLIGRLEVWRVEADGVDLHVTREADGAVPVLDELFKAREVVATEKQVQKKTAASQPIDFSSPAYIDGFRLQHLRVHLTDKTLSPPMQTMAQLDLRVDDIGSSQRPTSFYMSLYCDPVLDGLTIEGQGRVGGASIDADVRVALRGLHLKPLAQYLEPLGVRPVSYDISASATGTLKTSPASLVSALSEIAAATRPGSRPASTGPAAAAALASATATQPANPPTQPVDTAFPADPKPAEFVGGSLKLTNLSLLTDGREAAACDVFEIDIARAKLGVLHLSRILIDGVRASAVRNAEGNLVAAGVELIPVVPAARPTPAPTHSASPAAATTGRTLNGGTRSGGTQNAATGPASPQVALDELLIRNLKLTLDDRFVSGNEPLAFEVERFSVRDLVLDPSRPDAQLTIAGAFRSSGIARSISLDGTARPFAQSKTLHLRFDVSGIQPTALQPYLDFAGLESNLKDASFTANLDAEATIDPSGKLGAAMRIGDISFRDGDELFGMNGVKFAGIELNPASGMLKVGEIEVVGPALAFRREKDGSFSGFGFRTKQATPYPDRPAPPPSEPMELRLGRFELGRFTWKDVAVRFEDDASVPPASVAIGDARLEITDVVFDVNGADLEDRMPGRIRGWLMAPGLAERLDLEGTLIPGPDSFAVRVQLSGDGITAGGLSSYLKTLGIEPLLKQGMFLAHVQAKVGGTADGIKASLAIEDAVYADGQAELAGVDLVKLDEITLEGSTLSLGLIEIRRPRATVTLEKDGAVVAAGMRYTPVMSSAVAPSSPAPPSAVPPSQVPSSAVLSSQVAPVAPARARPAPRTTVMLQGLQLTDAALTLNDQSAARPVRTTARVNATLGALALGQEGPPADLSLVLKADDIVDQVTVTGKVLANPKAQGAVLDIDVAGLSGKALEGYLPDGTTFALTGGRLRTSIDAGVEQLDHGGIKGWLLVNGLDYRDGDGPTLLKLDQFRITMPRFDPAGDTIAIDDVSLSGLEMETRKTADGAFEVLGLAVSNAVAPVGADQQPGIQRAAGQPAAAPAVAGGPTATIPASAAADTTAIVARARQALPLITLNTLDLNVRRIGYLDLSSAGNQPLTVADLRLRTLEQLKLLGPDPMNQPPAKLQLTGRVDPLIGAVDVQVQTAPFAQQPSLNATVLLSGISGEGIFAVAPNLRELIDASELTDGQFRTKIEATATLDRRGPMDIDFAKGFDVEAIIQGIELRTQPGGQIALGLEELRVEDAKVRPVKDDAGNQLATSVRIKSVDLTNPIGRLVRDKDGIRVAGLLVKMPADPATQPSTPTAAESPAAERPATGAPPATAPALAAAKPAGEIQIDKFTISGIDFRVIDRSVEPPFVLPLTALDLDVRGLTNLAMHEPDRPIRLSANLNSGKVSLPRKIESKGIVGAVGGVANLIGAAAQQKPAEQAPIEYEERELFSQISVNGKLSLYPQADGYLKLNVNSFEIPAVAGYAKEQDVTLSYGTFNLPLNLRGDGKGGFVVDTRPAFTDLALTDPQSLIARYIGLSVPTDLAIGSVEAADKSISIPVVGVTITPDATGTYNIGGIQKQILPAVASVFLNAIRPDAMGSKVVGGALAVAGIEGLLAGNKKPVPPVVLSFPSGFAGLEPLELAKVRSLAERMKREPDLTLSVKHELGGSDLSIMQVRANPTTADAEAMAYALRQRKLELTALRGEVAATTRTQLAAGSDDSAAPAVEQLRTIDRELSRTEDAMDRMYDLLRPGAERHAPRRTRAAALDLGQQRLDAIRAVLVSAGVQGLTDRLNLARPAFDAADNAEGGTATITLVKVKK